MTNTTLYAISSPGGQVLLEVQVGAQITWAVTFAGQPLLLPSALALELEGGEVLGRGAAAVRCENRRVESSFAAIHYRKAQVRDVYEWMRLDFAGGYALEFRAYDDAVAYRWILERSGVLQVQNEGVEFRFAADFPAFVPYLRDYREGEVFNSSFESLYSEHPLSAFEADTPAMLPLLVDIGQGRKALILEADLEDYPGLYMGRGDGDFSLRGRFPAYPLAFRRGGFGLMNLIPTQRADYIARIKGPRSLPWRALALAQADADLLNNDIVQKLAASPRFQDHAWLEVGQVAWDWWHDYSLTGVDFEAGMNTATFFYHIDFAAEYGARFIILDAGWSDTFDLFAVNPAVDLPAILAHAAEKGVGVILWASWYTITQQMHEVFPHYAVMGVRGWKIDFIDRDDQLAVASTYEIAALAAQHHLLVDYHGVFKPTGLQRTYPNVVGYEGVYGLENCKWADYDAPRYDATLPFARNLAGPMDYTSGAMINATRADYKPRNHAPMSLGTRCHQLAQYIVFEAPLQMLSDSPTAYQREPEYTAFLTSIPTTFDETVPLAGAVGQYAAVARRRGSTWYVGALCSWDGADLELDCGFLGEGMYWARVYADGINAHRTAADYTASVIHLQGSDRLRITLAPGGGWAARIERIV